MRGTDGTRDGYRAARLAEIPRWYSPFGHLAGTAGIAVAATVIAAIKLEDVGWADLLVIPFIIAFANFFEWWAHKHVLHRPRKWFRGLYEQHTPRHHRIYVYGDMAVHSRREWKFVLMPALGVLGIVIFASPMALGLGLLFGPNVGWLALLTQALYVTAYELTHLAYHLPPDHPVQRIGLIRRLGEHHARHHDPALMAKWNFNVTIPLADKVLGTVAPDGIARRPDQKG